MRDLCEQKHRIGFVFSKRASCMHKNNTSSLTMLHTVHLLQEEANQSDLSYWQTPCWFHDWKKGADWSDSVLSTKKT